MIYSISNDFSKTPGLRYRYQSEFSGEEFREDHLIKLYSDAVALQEIITLDLDGTYGYPDSFISEAFGGLARELCKSVNSRQAIVDRFRFISKDQPDLIDKIESIMLSEGD